MTHPPEKRAQWLTVYAETRSKSRACNATGVNMTTIRDWEDSDEEFAAGIREVQMWIGDLVHNVVIDRALNGWEETALYKGLPVTDPATGEPVTVRRFSDKLLLATAEQVAGWGQRKDQTETPRKEVTLIGPDGKPMGLQQMLFESFTRVQLQAAGDPIEEEKPKGLPPPKKPRPRNGRPPHG